MNQTPSPFTDPKPSRSWIELAAVLVIASLCLAFGLWAGNRHGREAAREDIQNTARDAVGTLRKSDPVAARMLEAAAARADEADQQVKSLARLRELGLAIRLYADVTSGHGPPDLASMGSEPGPVKDNPSILAPIIPGRKYVYLGYKESDPPTNIVIYESPATRDGFGVLWHDGHATWESGSGADAVMAKINGK